MSKKPRISAGVFAEMRLKKWAREFATIYKENGELAAGAYISANVKPDDYKAMQPYVLAAMEDLGYTFPKGV